MSLSKVQIEGTKLPVSRFDYSHDTLTTFAWGEVQPVHCRLLPVAGMKTKISTDYQIRLAPMPSPTFGRMFFRQYHQFVPITDIFKQFPHFLAQIERLNNVGNLMERVSRLPTLTTDVLMYYLCKGTNSHSWIYYRGGNNVTTNAWSPSVTAATTNQNWNSIFRGVGATPVNFNFGASPGGFSLNSHSWKYDPNTSDFRAVGYDTTLQRDFCFTAKLTRKGMRLYKAILGAGLKPSFDTDVEISALPLFAVYKSYWDVFHLPQFDNFESSSLYRLIRWYDVNGTDNVFSLSNDSQTWMSSLKPLWDAFFEDLANMWYSSNVDFVSAHLPYNIAASQTDMVDLVSTPEVLGMSSYNATSATPDYFSISTASLNPELNQWLTQLDDEYARKLYYYVNKKSQVGYNLRELLKLRGYGQWCDEVDSKYLGKSVSQITVSELLSTADTKADGGLDLGDYAGQGSLFDSKKPIEFTNGSIGYQITLAVIVPESRQSLALDGSALGVTPQTFYSPLFDGFGYSATPRICIGHDDRIAYVQDANGADMGNNIFGIKPRFMEYKLSNSIRSGCFALQSQRNTWNSWHLDKLIYQHENETVPTAAYSDVNMQWTDSVEPSGTPPMDIMPNAMSEWRYPTKFGFLGHYDRVFYDGQFSFDGIFDRNDELYPDDNFMCNMVFNCFASARMLPVSKTWETIECEEDAKGTYTVSK